MKVQKEDGSALLLTMVLILVLVFRRCIYTAEPYRGKQAQREEEQLQAYYLARSGADALAYYLEERPEEIESISTKGESIRIGTGGRRYLWRVCAGFC